MSKLIQINLNSKIPQPIANPQINDFLSKNHLNSGKSYLNNWIPAHVAIEDDKESPPGLTDMMLTVPFCIVSRRFFDLLARFNCDCEYLPLIIGYNEKIIHDEFFALNILSIVYEAIDIDKSIVGYYDSEFNLAEDIEKLVLKNDFMSDAPLVYLREFSKIAVNKEIATAIADDNNLVGIEIIDPEKFTSY